MSLELKIYKELATLNATAAQWLQFRDIVASTQPKSEFKKLFGDMIIALTGSYNVVIETLLPFTEMHSLEQFTANFDDRQQGYQEFFYSRQANLAILPKRHTNTI